MSHNPVNAFLRALVVCHACLLLVAGTAAAAAPKLTVVLEDKEDFPNIIGDGEHVNERLPGLAIEIVRLVGQRLKLQVVIKRMPWKRCIDKEIREGKADAVLPISYLKEREKIGAFPMKGGVPDKTLMLSMQSYVFYKLRGSTINWDGKTVKGLKGVVGAPPGYSVVDTIKGMGLQLEDGFTLNNMRKLASNRIQLVASLELEGDQVLANHPELNHKIEKLSPPIVTKPYFLMLSHQFVSANPQLARKIWSTLKTVREQEYEKLLLKYY